MTPLLVLDAARQSRERTHAARAEEAVRLWRRAWRRIYVECMLYFCVGYLVYGLSFHLTDGNRAAMLVALSFVVCYVLPLVRLLQFFLGHADDF